MEEFQSFFMFFASFCIGQISHQQHKGEMRSLLSPHGVLFAILRLLVPYIIPFHTPREQPHKFIAFASYQFVILFIGVGYLSLPNRTDCFLHKLPFAYIIRFSKPFAVSMDTDEFLT